jgi:hypothetical protein
LAVETRKTGRQPGLPIHRRGQRRIRSQLGNVPGSRTDSKTAMRICAQKPRLRLIADHPRSGCRRWLLATNPDPGVRSRSRPLARRAVLPTPLHRERVGPDELPGHRRRAGAPRGVDRRERLVALSLASYANSDQQAWPSTEVAAARVGLARSRYLAARGSLAERGLIRVEHAGAGRGKSSLVTLLFTE